MICVLSAQRLSLIWCIGWLQTRSAPEHCCTAKNAKQIKTVAITFIPRKLLNESDTACFFYFLSQKCAERAKAKIIQVLYIRFPLAALKEDWWSPSEFSQRPKSKWWCVCPPQCCGRLWHSSCTFSLIPFRLKRKELAWRPGFLQPLSFVLFPLWLLPFPLAWGAAFLHV